MVKEDVIWQPLPGSQELFLSCPVYECLYSGTRGGGKTDTFIMDFVQHVGVGWGPEWRGILFRETFPQLADVVAKCNKWLRRAFPDANYNCSEHTWTFRDGEQLLLRHMRKEDDYWNYHGHSYPWIGWEELTNWATPNCYKIMMSCSRTTVDANARDKFGRPMPIKYRATTNPYGKGHNWIKKRFRLPGNFGVITDDDVNDEGEKLPPRVALQSHISENTILLAADPNYIMRLRSAARNKAEEDAWLHGAWDITSGGMFDDLFERSIHVIDPFEIPHTWRIERAFDWGSSAPFSVGWWAESDGSDAALADGRSVSTVKGDKFRIGEWYGSSGGTNEGLRLTATQISAGIVAREISLGLRNSEGYPTRVRPGPADSSIWSTTGLGDDKPGKADKQATIAGTMAKPVRVNGHIMPGVSWIKADKSPGSRKNGWEKIREMLESSKAPKGGGPRENPGMFIFSTCKAWIELVPPLPRSNKDPDDADTDAEDHCFTGDTLVDTPQGPVAIKDLPESGFVHSIEGVCPYIGARMTRKNAEIVKLTFSNGITIRCTPDHKWLTPRGWVRAVDMRNETGYATPFLRGEKCKNLTGKNTINATPTTKTQTGGCTLRFGNITTVKCRAAIACTILIITKIIMQLKTYSLCPIASTLRTIQNLGRKLTGATSRLHKKRLVNGTAPKKGMSGTNINTKSTAKVRCISVLAKIAKSVGLNIKGLLFKNFVMQTAKPEPTVVCLKVEKAPKEDVYCLTVPLTNCFSVQGMIVHNCGDETRYYVMRKKRVSRVSQQVGILS